MFPAGGLLMARIVRRGFDQPASDGPIESGRPGAPVEALPSAAAEGQP
jgi:hypothetical protein